MPSSHHVCFASLRNDAGELNDTSPRPSAPFCWSVAASAKKNAATRATISATRGAYAGPPTAATPSSRINPVDEVEPLGTMRDQEHRAVVGSFEHVRDESLGGGAVEMCGRLVEDQHRRVGEQRSRDDETLALAARELCALLPDVRVEAVRERLDPCVEASTAQRVVKLVVRRIRSREAKVLADRRVEDVGLLPREREGPAHVLLPQPADVDAVERDPARLGIEEAQEQVRDRRLPGAARADECQAAPGIEPEVEAVESRRLPGRVRRCHSLQSDGDLPSRGRRGLRWIGHARLAVGQLEHASSGGERRRELPRRAR